MESRRRQPEHATPRRGRGHRFVRKVAVVLMLVAALLVVGRQIGHRLLDRFLLQEVTRKLADHYEGLDVSLRSVQRVAGEGLRLNGLRIADPALPSARQTLLEIREVFLACDVSYAALAARQVPVKHVDVRHARLHAARDEAGRWSTAALMPLPDFGGATVPPTANIENAEVQLEDEFEGRRALQLRHIQLSVSPRFESAAGSAPRPVSNPGPPLESPDASLATPAAPATQVSQVSQVSLQVELKMESDHFKSMACSGVLDPRSGAWQVTGKVQSLELSPELAGLLPNDLAGQIRPLALLRGKTDLDFTVRNPRPQPGSDSTSESSDTALAGDAPSWPLDYELRGTLYEGRVDDPCVPYALTRLQADYYCDNQGFRVDNMSARSGFARVNLSCAQRGYRPGSPLVFSARCEQLPLDRRLIDVLPPEMSSLWQKFAPAGRVNADIRLVYDGRRFQPQITVHCPEVSFTYDKFPYRVSGATGTLKLNGNRLTIDLQARVGGQLVHLDGEITDPGPDSYGWIEMRSEGPVPLDEKLIQALEEKPQAFVRSLHPAGSLNFWGRFEKDAQGELRKRLEIDLINCSISYEKFAYPLNRIQGRLSMVDDRWTFEQLKGRNDSAYVVCSGSWDPHVQDGVQVALDFVGTDVPLEDELRTALKDDVQRFWNRLRPRGTLDQLNVHLRMHADKSLALNVHAEKWPAGQNVDGRSITVEPEWFPYRVDNVSGTFDFRDGVMQFKNLTGRHGRTQIHLDGDFASAGDDWTVQLHRLVADRLSLDRDFIDALPPEVARGLVRLKLGGPIDLDGRLTIAGNKISPDSPRFDWDLNVAMEGTTLQCGVSLSDVRGNVRLIGQAGRGTMATRGELFIDSLILKDQQLTKVQGPIWIDPHQILLGSWTHQWTGERIPRQVTAQVFDGTLALDASVKTEADHPFQLVCSLSQADLAQIARDLSGGPRQVSGKTFAMVKMSGTAAGSHTWKGSGLVRLRDADIYESPLMIVLFQSLRKQRADATAFTTSDIDFQIVGDRIYFNRMEFKGDVLTLKGHGEMNLQRQIQLSFYTLVGRDELQLPILRPLFTEASRNILLIEVGGTLDHPEISRRAFPELNETLQQLFPEAVRRGPNSSAPGPLGFLEGMGVSR